MDPLIVNQILTQQMQLFSTVGSGQISYAAAVGKYQTEQLIVNPSNPTEVLSQALSQRSGQPPIATPVGTPVGTP